ncbi:UBN2 domain-containing protein [Cephalotus follicularis]|uniref:UBN2 domain-containing protein n=1 Tax=Cephalotus follicularis TaxID=3775 RepID=A0A1Q3BPK4_CEPFO|nr:UBN2 domain-containing protein [Cephalotus follicularis]
MQLRLSLHSLKKGAYSMTTYLLKTKSISGELALASRPVSDDDMVLYILGGLSSEYAAFVTSVITRDTTISVADLHGLLLNEEIRCQSSISDLITATANMALTSRSSENRKQYRGRGHGRQSSSSSHINSSSNKITKLNNQAKTRMEDPDFCSQCHHSNNHFHEPYQESQTYYQNQVPPQAHLANHFAAPHYPIQAQHALTQPSRVHPSLSQYSPDAFSD